MTCWRRLRDWTRPGVWARLHELLLAEFDEAGKIDWSRAAVDSRSPGPEAVARRPAPARWIGGRRGASTT